MHARLRVFAKMTLLLLTLLVVRFSSAAAGAEDRLAGTWELVSFKVITADGRAGDTSMGRNPVGWIMYDGRGHMCVEIARSDRPNFSSTDGFSGNPDEEKAAYEGYIAYCGAYVVNEAEGFVIHHLAFSLYPNWTGTDQKRFFQVSGDRLTLTTPPFFRGGQQLTARLVWERLR